MSFLHVSYVLCISKYVIIFTVIITYSNKVIKFNFNNNDIKKNIKNRCVVYM